MEFVRIKQSLQPFISRLTFIMDYVGPLVCCIIVIVSVSVPLESLQTEMIDDHSQCGLW